VTPYSLTNSFGKQASREERARARHRAGHVRTELPGLMTITITVIALSY